MSKNTNIFSRIVINAAILFIHHHMMTSQGDKMKEAVKIHPELKLFHDLGARYYTLWNILIQILYAAIAVLCDITTLINISSVMPEGLRKFRYNLFAGLVFPISASILPYWGYFFYDREMIFPSGLDMVVPLHQNIMAHAGVFMYALSELMLLPKNSIEDGEKPRKYLIWFSVVYISVVLYTRYVDLGIWCYKTMDYFQGPLFMFNPIIVTSSVAFIAFRSQWRIRAAILKK